MCLAEELPLATSRGKLVPEVDSAAKYINCQDPVQHGCFNTSRADDMCEASEAALLLQLCQHGMLQSSDQLGLDYFCMSSDLSVHGG